MNSRFWLNFLHEIENLQMFALCKDFDELSLEDDRSKSGYRGNSDRFSRYWTHDIWSVTLIEQLRAPFKEVPRGLMDSFQSYNIRMSLGFRFLPGQLQFLTQELKLPESFDR